MPHLAPPSHLSCSGAPPQSTQRVTAAAAPRARPKSRQQQGQQLRRVQRGPLLPGRRVPPAWRMLWWISRSATGRASPRQAPPLASRVPTQQAAPAAAKQQSCAARRVPAASACDRCTQQDRAGRRAWSLFKQLATEPKHSSRTSTGGHFTSLARRWSIQQCTLLPQDCPTHGAFTTDAHNRCRLRCSLAHLPFARTCHTVPNLPCQCG